MKQEERGNPILLLAEEIEKRTENLCMAGAGPGGFGVCNENASSIGLLIQLKPDPVKGDQVFPEGIDHYQMSVRAFSKCMERELETKDIIKAQQTGKGETKIVANAAAILSEQSCHVTREDCMDAFGVLAQREMDAVYGPEESAQIGLTGSSL